MLNKKNIAIIVFIVIVSGILFSLIYYPPTPREVEPGELNSEIVEELPDKQFKGLKLLLYNQQKTINWELTALEVQDNSSRGRLEFSPVAITALDNTGQESYSIQAEKGVYLTKEEKISIKGPVKIKRNLQQITVGQLIWDKQQDILLGEDGVQIETPDFMIEGKRFQSDSVFSKLNVFGDNNQQASFYQKEEK